MSSIIKVNTFQDANGNALFSSDGSGTVTLDSNFSGVLPDNTPAFEAYLGSNASPSNDVWTKMAANIEIYDTDNAFDNSTNYRFTPQVAGKYFVYVGAQSLSVNNMYSTGVNFTKNGSAYKQATFQNGTNASYPLNYLNPVASGVVDLNGSTDYIEANIIVQTHSGGSITLKGGSEKYTYFGAYRLIGA